MAGTLAGFYHGGRHYAAAFDGDNFLGYKAGDVAFDPVDFTGQDVILGLVCKDGFRYIKFNTSLPGPLPRQVNLPLPVVDGAMFPIVTFLGQRQDGKGREGRSRRVNIQGAYRGGERAAGRCVREAGAYTASQARSIGYAVSGFIRCISRQGVSIGNTRRVGPCLWSFPGYRYEDIDVLPEKKWLLKVYKDAALRELFDNDKYKFYSLALQDFQKEIDQLELPPALAENDLLTFVTPAGTTISLPKTVQNLSFHETISSDAEDALIPGCLMGFTIGNVSYEAQLLSGSFVGYTTGSSFYDTDAQVSSGNVMLGLPGKSKNGMVFRLVKFHLQGLKRYEKGGGVIRDVLDFPPVYTFDTPQVDEAAFTEGQLKELQFVRSSLTYSDVQKRVIERYSQSQELLAAYKAAQLGTKYPVLLDVHTRFFDEWERATMPGMNYWDEIVYRSGTNTSAPVNYVKLWKDDKRIFYHEFIKNFRSEIGRWAAFRKPEFLARLEEPDYLTRMIHWDVKLALDKFTETDRKALTADQRIKILRLLTRSELVGGTYEAPEAFQLLPVPIEFSLKGNELVALDIIESTPPEQRRYILDRLIDVQVGREKDDRRMLLPALCQDFDGQEFERFIINISAWVEQNVRSPKIPRGTFLRPFRKVWPFRCTPVCGTGPPVSKSFSNDGKKVLLHTTDTKVVGWEDVYVGGPDGYMFHEITETTEYNVTASPYEYIVVQFKENFQLSDSKIFRKNERVLMPAIFGYMIFNRMNAKRLQRAGKFGVEHSVGSAWRRGPGGRVGNTLVGNESKRDF